MLDLQFGRTEWIKNTLNPSFTKTFQMDYRFEEVQYLRFSVYDIDNSTSGLEDDDFLGLIECTLGEVCGCGCTACGRGFVGRTQTLEYNVGR